MQNNSMPYPWIKELLKNSKLRAVILITILFSIALVFTVDGFNGPNYWIWSWRRLPFARVFFFMAVAMIPFAFSQWIHDAKRRRYWAVFLLSISCLALQLATIGTSRRTDTFTLTRLHDYILLRKHTGYFQDAETFTNLRDWCTRYPEIISSDSVSPHSHNKPPGPILFYVIIRSLISDTTAAADVAGLMIAMLAALSVIAVYALLSSLTNDEAASFAGATYYSLCPGLILFLPQFDQTFPILTCSLLGVWWIALHSSGRWYAWAGLCGIVLAISLFISYNFLLLGAGMALLGLWALQRGRLTLGRGAAISTTVLGTVVLIYIVLFVSTGYDPIHTFITCYRNQAGLAQELARPWPRCIPWDLYDFALGSAWLSYLLVFYFGANHLRPGSPQTTMNVHTWAGISEPSQIAWICLAQIGVTAISGLLRTETARVWLFLLPLLMLPVGLELKTWKPLPRSIVYLCAWFLLLLIHRHMWFMRG